MTPTPPSTASSSHDGNSPVNPYRVVRKRNRVPLSCAPCRSRKLKCDRALPCEKCVKRGDGPACTYAMPTSRKRNSQSSSSSPNSDEMQNRIDRLEGLVLSLMSGGDSKLAKLGPGMPSGSESIASGDFGQSIDEEDMIKEETEGEEAESDVEQVTNTFGVLKVNDKNQQQVYMGETHWAAVLKDITELKEYWSQNQNQKQYQDQVNKVNEVTRGAGPTLIYGCTVPPTEEFLRASLPHRNVVDKLILHYFAAADHLVHIFHKPTFFKDYENHWADPSKTDAVYLSVLYAMMCLSLISYDRSGNEPPEYVGKTGQLANEYRQRTVQCLVRADFAQAHSNSARIIEALVLYTLSEYQRVRDSSVGVWLVVETVTRLAMRSGYHRDSKRFSSISPFQGEMRRRIWTQICQGDLYFSFQVGLPPTLRAADCDTELPRNLLDEDIWDGMPELPPSRPMDEVTPTSYMIVMSSLAQVFREIVECTTALTPRPYEDIIRLDNLLQKEKAAFPKHLRLHSLQESSSNAPALDMQRFNVDLMYFKAQAVLHRRHLAKARFNSRYAYSRQVCVDASLQILQYQATLHNESRPGGRFENVRAYASSLTTHDFLLAAMVICLDGYYTAEAQKTGNTDYQWSMERGKELVSALSASRDIWVELKDNSIEAWKAATTLNVMINKLMESCPINMRDLFSNDTLESSQSGTKLNRFETDETKPEHSAAMTLGMLSGSLTPDTAAMFDRTFPPTPGGNVNMVEAPGASATLPMDYTVATAPSPFSFFGNNPGMMNDMPANLDFEAWDSYLQGSSLDTAGSMFPNNLDIPGETIGTQGQLDPGQQDNQQQRNFYNPGGVFMGVQSPSTNGYQ